MKTRHSAQVARWLSLISVLLVFVAVGKFPSGYSATERIEPFPQSCPPPFNGQAGICVLGQTETISTTIEPASNTTLDCQGNALRASTSGQGTGPWPGSRSSPEVAIFLNGVQNVIIQNCVIQDFDFGIIALNSKRQILLQSARRRTGVKAKTIAFMPNKILGNTITARFTPISLMAVDETEIKKNRLTYLTIGGTGMYVARNSDRNVIQGNVVVADFSSGRKGALMVPGPLMPAPDSSLSTNPQLDAAPAIVVTQILGPEPTLLNVIIGGPTGTLHQIVFPSAFPGDISGGNVIDDNTITYPSPSPSPSPTPPITGNDGIAISATAESVVSNNQIWYASAGIRAGIQIGTGGVKQFPGKCSLDETRLCLQNSDCEIPGFDAQSKGSCALPAKQNVFWLASDNSIATNEIHGPFAAGIVVAGQNTIIQGNVIEGNVSQGPRKGTAISLLGKYALETTTVTANKITKVDIGISLLKTFEESAKSFGTNVSGNAITDYNTPVQTNGRPSKRYDLTSELSVNGEGNYWGPPCPPGLNPINVKDVTDPPNSLNCDAMGVCTVTDSHCLVAAPLRVQPPSNRVSRKRQQNRSVSRKKKLRTG